MKRFIRNGMCAAAASLGVAAIAASSACGTSFDSVSKVLGVRILATKVDTPYAKPGANVNLTMLIADGRTDKTTAVNVSWLPFICTDPVQDLYYACFAQTGASDAGTGDANLLSSESADGGPSAAPGALAQIAKIPPNTNISPFLPHGLTYSFSMPVDAITKHPPVQGSPEPYGLAVLFNYACAGHLQVIPVSRNNVQQIPIGCFDDEGNQLGEDDGIFGLVRVYAYSTTVNQNPVIGSVTQDGIAVDLSAGLTLPHCTESDRKNCNKTKITPVVPDSSWELNPDDKDENGNPQHEEVWVDYYSDLGDLGDDARLLFDVSAGRINSPEVDYKAPSDPGEGTIWIVVHDSRGGVEWSVVPLHIQ